LTVYLPANLKINSSGAKAHLALFGNVGPEGPTLGAIQKLLRGIYR